ncbi:MAG: PD-(D/E)XK nuclease family transposase, partial [Bacteroidales bacterium]|nr:PD-(D/E)XK nuclease family transposase [Bacteroidales bacterium]
IVFAEMDKYKKLAEKGRTKKDLWMRYFTEMTEKTRKPASELLADPDIAKAIELLEIINYNEIEQELYDRYWDAVSVEATWKSIGERDGEKKGIDLGIKQGREEERHQLARNMLAKDLDPALVAEITGLTIEKIKNYLSVRY